MELGNLMFGNSRGIYPSARGGFQDAFLKMLEDIGFDNYGYAPKHLRNKFDEFENDVFFLKPYYWGDDENEMAKPNFVFKETGYELQWYKYPLRDAYCNQKLPFKEFKEMLRKCVESVKGADKK